MIKSKSFIFSFIIVLAILCFHSDTYAGSGDVMWQEDGISVFFPDSGKMEKLPVAVSDGNDGTIIAWEYQDVAYYGIRAQRLDSNGNKLWWESGKSILSDTHNSTGIKMISDNNGGAIIAWMEDPLVYGVFKICVERIDNAGDSVWDPGYGGIPVCGSTGSQILTDIVTDGAGGVILVWEDDKNMEISNKDIYAQRVDAEGNLLWGTDGLPVCTADHAQEFPRLVSDGTGGAIITWHDTRAVDYNKDIYAQRVDADGNFLWQENGIVICSNSEYQEKPSITTDSAGGAIIVWQDNRNTGASNVRDIYAQRINPLGQIQWENDGVAICTKPGDQKLPRLVSDNAYGAFVVWEDGVGNVKIYAQRVDANGVLAWDPNGVSIGTAGSYQLISDVIEDNFFGVIIVWSGNPEDDCEIHAQDISFTGEKLWSEAGITINGLGTGQGDARISKGVNSDIVIAWTDKRYDNGDIFAQRVSINKVPSWDFLIGSLFADNKAEAKKANLFMYRIRDEFLYIFPEGKVLTYLTYKSADEIGRITLKDSSLRKIMYAALIKVIGICADYLNNRYGQGYIPLTDDFHKELTYIVRRLSILGSKGLKNDLFFVQCIINKIKGKTVSGLEKIFLKS